MNSPANFRLGLDCSLTQQQEYTVNNNFVKLAYLFVMFNIHIHIKISIYVC